MHTGIVVFVFCIFQQLCSYECTEPNVWCVDESHELSITAALTKCSAPCVILLASSYSPIFDSVVIDFPGGSADPQNRSQILPRDGETVMWYRTSAQTVLAFGTEGNFWHIHGGDGGHIEIIQPSAGPNGISIYSLEGYVQIGPGVDIVSQACEPYSAIEVDTLTGDELVLSGISIRGESGCHGFVYGILVVALPTNFDRPLVIESVTMRNWGNGGISLRAGSGIYVHGVTILPSGDGYLQPPLYLSNVDNVIIANSVIDASYESRSSLVRFLSGPATNVVFAHNLFHCGIGRPELGVIWLDNVDLVNVSFWNNLFVGCANDEDLIMYEDSSCNAAGECLDGFGSSMICNRKTEEGLNWYSGATRWEMNQTRCLGGGTGRVDFGGGWELSENIVGIPSHPAMDGWVLGTDMLGRTRHLVPGPSMGPMEFQPAMECYGIDAEETEYVCGGIGVCTDAECVCPGLLTGPLCDETITPLCGGPKNGCNDLGVCVDFDVCECDDLNEEDQFCVPEGTGPGPGPVCGSMYSVSSDGLSCVLSSGSVAGVIVGSIAGVGFFGFLIAALIVVVVCFIRQKHSDGGTPRSSMLSVQMNEGEDAVEAEIDESFFKIGADEMKLVKFLGEGGGDATVYLATWNGLEVAYKVFRVSLNSAFVSDFQKELSLAMSLHHPHLIQTFGATFDRPKVGIVMELCTKGDIGHWIVTHQGTIGTEKKIEMLRGIAMGLAHLHNRDVVHRDIKMENVLLTDALVPKLADFGLSRLIKAENSSNTRRVGTSFYMAPEVMMSGNYTSKIDIYSFGILAYCLLCETVWPYGDRDEVDYVGIEFRTANDPSCRPELSALESCELGRESVWLGELVSRCWQAEPGSRPTAKEITEEIDSRTKNQK